MPASTAQNPHAFTLAVHRATPCPWVRSISGKIARTPGGLMVTYVLAGDVERLHVPARQAPRLADDLWRHTCFEMFVASDGATPYHEFNFSPSGEWAVYAFSGYRERVPLHVSPDLDPHVTSCRSDDRLELDAIVRVDALSLRDADAKLSLGLSAVIEDSEGRLSYWALKHPSDKPDFHRREAFALELDEIRH